MTRAQLLEGLLVERFTHLPETPAHQLIDGPSAEVMLQQRRVEAEAAHVVTVLRRRALTAEVPSRRSQRAIS